MFIKHGLHQKSHISGHLLRRPPLAFFMYMSMRLCELVYMNMQVQTLQALARGHDVKRLQPTRGVRNQGEYGWVFMACMIQVEKHFTCAVNVYVCMCVRGCMCK
jgi:hypothetical protein